MAYLAQQVNSGITYNGQYFQLADNVDLSADEWVPIGTDQTNSFQGTLDGNNKTITGLKIGT
ncbi:hypothetical protein MTBBW1_1090004 [Desulfamplus magnetovallimortis]|uniref:Uncharacterized protein n=1 Tax=Desulfamplus magnetovallimortis TaxID=1246637 RepID=A0A1W1H5F5_9BACT|nr:hypothetical protein [Desulfamplus magnetovallimortis]SLM27713.1 hypothetical protein MTBBW1_1090004 [Desulfamplus magnetovallimortis]